MQEAYSIYDTKTHLSKLIKRVRAGGEIIISDRGTPVAKISPIKKEMSFEEHVSHLKAIGQIRPGKKQKLSLGKTKSHGAFKRFLEERE